MQSMERATQRPAGFTKPGHWTSDPAPTPRQPEAAALEAGPTRYGDWVKDGIAIDF